MLQFEIQRWNEGYSRLAGVDEVGRGPLAGPVVAAAVVFTRAFAESEQNGLLKGLNDSKQISQSARERFSHLLYKTPGVEIGLGVADVLEIDTLNILRASHLAMRRALEALPVLPDHTLVDGLAVEGLPCSSTPIVGGDSKSLTVAAASVIAKVFRDAQMVEYDRQYPVYGFARHKGYGSRAHIQALFEYGPCELHRRSFRPVREALEIRRRTEAFPPPDAGGKKKSEVLENE